MPYGAVSYKGTATLVPPTASCHHWPYKIWLQLLFAPLAVHWWLLSEIRANAVHSCSTVTGRPECEDSRRKLSWIGIQSLGQSHAWTAWS